MASPRCSSGMTSVREKLYISETSSDSEAVLSDYEGEYVPHTSEEESSEKESSGVEKTIEDFIKDDSKGRHVFEPMEHVLRGVVLDVVEVAGVSAFMVGEEGVDRHVVAYKREFAPSEDELAVLRRGEEWTPEKAKEIADQRERDRLEAEEASKKRSSREEKNFVPASNFYKDKYRHLIGEDAALAAAKKTETNRAYGFVPSENKKDVRSIEQTLADLQRRKRQKVEEAGARQESPEAAEPSA